MTKNSEVDRRGRPRNASLWPKFLNFFHFWEIWQDHMLAPPTPPGGLVPPPKGNIARCNKINQYSAHPSEKLTFSV